MQQTYFNFLKNYMQHAKLSMRISKYYVQSKFCHRDNLFISGIFFCAPGKVSYATNASHYVISAISERSFDQKAIISDKKY